MKTCSVKELFFIASPSYRRSGCNLCASFWANACDVLCAQKLDYTLQGTNISPEKSILKMIFLFPRWDMLIPWRVIDFFPQQSCEKHWDQIKKPLFLREICALIGRVKYEPHCFFESSIAGRFVGTWYLEIWIYLFLWLVILWLWCGAKSAIPHRGVKKTTCVEKGFNRHRSWWGLTGEDSGFLFFASVFGP